MDVHSPAGERTWAVAAHLTALLNLFSAPLPGLIGSGALFFLTRERGGFAHQQAREAFNLQLTLLLVELALVIGAVAAFGRDDGPSGSFFLLVAAGVAAALASVVLGVVGAVRANRGEGYRYPFILRLVR
ncbi:MAG: uncharacterized protein QOI11_1309 [Candidatus Eremiobacteraeota bacterium]|jgi:uncharacterized Tic20 family protein|nr:uncharacterized protein [Candidatus Eremiobacteraeota bacterium]